MTKLDILCIVVGDCPAGRQLQELGAHRPPPRLSRRLSCQGHQGAKHQKHPQSDADAPRTLQTLPERSTRLSNARQPPGTPRTAHDRRLRICWPPRVRRRPLSEILLWSTGSPASWRVSQTPECSGLLTATRGICMIVPQRQPGKFKSEQPNSPRSLAVPAGRRGRGTKPIPRKGGRAPCPSGASKESPIARKTSVGRII